MTLSEKQSDFLRMFVELMGWVYPQLASNVIVRVVEWNRTRETQEFYFKRGVTRTLDSKHIDGLAVDIAIIRDGNYVTAPHEYELMGKRWIELGGEWGGEWTSISDPYHFEYNAQRRKEVRDAAS